MKRYSDLYPRIWAFENLVAAAYRARRGKRFRPDVAAFHYHLEPELLVLREELRARTYQPGPYRALHIRDPKPRLISAAAYHDRVVHHALCQVIEPLFERTFIHDSYANRQGKGTHQALDRCTYFARRYAYVLKCDIQKYFPSIDHDILFACLAHKMKCPDTLWLIRRIIDNSNPQGEVLHYFPGDTLFTPIGRRHGIPIGNLTRQFFANVYLNGLDHQLKQSLGCHSYVCFADDFLIFANDKRWLSGLPAQMQSYLNRPRLYLHPRKCQLVPTRSGVEFLGWLVYPDHRRLRRSTGVRFQRRLHSLQRDYREGLISLADARASVMSWIGHLQHGDTWGLRRKLLASVPFITAAPSPGGREART